VSKSTELQSYLKKYPDTRYLDIFYCDLSCVIRGKRYPIDQGDKVFSSGMMTPGSCFLLGVNGESMDPEGMGFSDGDPDEVGKAVPGTLVPSPWAQIPTAQVMLTLESLNGDPYFYEPRNVLARTLEKFNALGLRPVVAFEPEFYLVQPNRGDKGELLAPVSPLTGQETGTSQVYSMDDIEEYALFLDEITSTCTLQGITTGAISGEYSPAQFEINLLHCDDPMKAADQYIMYRRVVQGVARKHGFQASFMAKPYLQHAGSGLHFHISLINENGENVLDGGGEYGTPACGTDTLFHAIGGLKEAMPDSMGILAPNTNAYRRFVPNIFVPVTPCWGYENRSVAMRIPKSPGNARRIEHRVAGADANPYLAISALLAGVHHGITHKVDPGPESIGNAGEQVDPNLPLDLESAMNRTRNSKLLAKYWGQDYLKAYTSCKLDEFKSFKESGQDETQWYL
jgi:glutamine synthetase